MLKRKRALGLQGLERLNAELVGGSETQCCNSCVYPTFPKKPPVRHKASLMSPNGWVLPSAIFDASLHCNSLFAVWQYCMEDSEQCPAELSGTAHVGAECSNDTISR